jgi:hypothetical protein
MCTVSWLYQDGGYQLFCNRDEQRTRRPAYEPQLLMHGAVQFLAPIDGDFGGTWIAVNECGVSLALVNRARSSAAKLSRGLLPMSLIRSHSLSEVEEAIHNTELSDFAPFALAALEPGSRVKLFHWDDRKLTTIHDADFHLPLVSSSFDPERVERERRDEFRRLCDRPGNLRPGTLLALHASHRPEYGPYSPCMHRDDAETVSFTWVTVGPAEATLYYSPGSPCRSLAGVSRTLPLRPAADRDGTIGRGEALSAGGHPSAGCTR